MPDKMPSIASQALELAAQYGADQAQVSISQARFNSIGFRDDNLEKAISSIKQSLTLTIYINQRFGIHTTSDFKNLDSFIDKACAFTKLLTPDPWRSLPDVQRLARMPGPDLKLYDERLAASPLDFWLDLARDMEKAAGREGQKASLVSATGNAYLNVGHSLLANSDGFRGAQAATSGFAAGGMAIMEEGGKRRQGFWYSGSCQMDEVLKPDLAQTTAALSLERARMQLGAKPGPTGLFPVLVENQAAGGLLEYLLDVISGYNLYNKTSYLMDSLGQAVASDKLTIIDKPHIPGGFGSNWFDGEGVATVERAVIKAGVLQSYLLNTYYARALNLKPNSGSTNNVTLTPTEDKNCEQLREQISEGLLLNSFLGGNFNSTTGDFSFGLSGQWIKNGRIAYAVEAMNMSGNFKGLWQNLSAVGNDPFPYSSMLSPCLLFDKVQLSG